MKIKILIILHLINFYSFTFAQNPFCFSSTAGNNVVGYHPRGIVSSDLNKDNNIDFITANDSTNTISVFLGTGNGLFDTAYMYNTGNINNAGTMPISICTSDFNHDSVIDIAVTNYSNDNISVLLGIGDGTFSSPTNYPAGVNPTSITNGEFNGDNNMDIVVSNRNNLAVSVLWGNGNGTFAAPLSYSAGLNYSYSLCTSDFDADGDLDLAVENGDATGFYVSILMNNGNGTFASPVNYLVEPLPYAVFSLTTNDFNGDGKNDIAAASSSGVISILMNNGNGTFSSYVSYTASNQSNQRPNEIISEDFDGDNIYDIAVVNSAYYGSSTYFGNIAILKGNGNGSFLNPIYFQAGDKTVALSSADFNNDGKADLSIANYKNNDVSILLNCLVSSIEITNDRTITLTIYPNPFSFQTNLLTDNFFNNAIFTIDNNLGQTVKQLKNISGQTIILHRDNLPSGLYFIRLSQDNQVIATEKLIITD